MIAVCAEEAEYPVVREFFELFKTPWEFYRDGGNCDVLICSGSQLPNNSAKLVLIFGSEQKHFDRESGIKVCSRRSGIMLSGEGRRIPLNLNCLTFESSVTLDLRDETTEESAAVQINLSGQTVVRLGFDLFGEIHFLLTKGQPPTQAATPTLELQIALIRDLITSHAISLVEIPPVPHDYNFVVCLTHDVDHPGVRHHKCDRTMFGFLYRATFGSLIKMMRGRNSLKQFIRNCGAVLSLPFVHLGIAKDFWASFDRYLEIEKNLPSTFFFIPKKGDPGQSVNGKNNSMRAAKYDINNLGNHIRRFLAEGREVGVHGIDAWRDSAMGRAELETVCRIAGASPLGVRMHWLYFDEQSPAILERAGFSYDSTMGYNETVGYRAGSTQAFKPLQTENMLELPMHLMDTALFYPSYMDLSPREAGKVMSHFADNAAQFGGVLTVNWHDRSIAPERCWDDSYTELLDDLKTRSPWFATASQAVDWFKKRRSAIIENVSWEKGAVRVKASLAANNKVPGLRIRVHKGATRTSLSPTEAKTSGAYVDVPFNENMDARIAL